MNTNKAHMLCILKVLQEYSDSSNIVTMSQLKSHLKNDYGLEPDRRTIYSIIDALIDLGYDISKFEENGSGYYLREREFEAGEIRLLLDAVYNCSYITQKQTEELLAKIRSFLSVNERKKYSYTNIINPDKKSPNVQVFLNIEILDQAINQHKQIEFTYLKYDENKELVPRREKKYLANPYAMICEDEHYYLVMMLEGHSDLAFYRVEMMKDIEILDSKITVSNRAANLDSIKKIVYAFSGEPRQIVLSCDEIGLRYAIEKFGKEIHIRKKKTDEAASYEIILTAPTEGMLYWALQYMEHIEVLAPDDLRAKITKVIRESNY